MPPSAAVPPLSVAGPLRLEPFRGLTLSPELIGDPSSARAFARPYRDVGERLHRWQESGRVHRDDTAAVYLHEYSMKGHVVRGLVGALEVSHRTDAQHRSAVLPHEAVHPDQARDLAARMTQMGLNPAPILLVHRGPASVRALIHELVQQAPDHDFTDQRGQIHRVWALRDPDHLATLADELAPSRALLADGHHRFAAYLQMQDQAPGTAADRGLAMLVDQDDTPLSLGAIHRLLVGLTMDDLVEAAAGLGEVHETTREPALAAIGGSTMALTDGHRWVTLTLEARADCAAVEVLHLELVPALPRAPARIGYHHDVDTTLTDLGHSGGVAALLPAPDFDVVRRILAADRLLPEKATSFQPKPSVGVLMRSLPDG